MKRIYRARFEMIWKNLNSKRKVDDSYDRNFVKKYIFLEERKSGNQRHDEYQLRKFIVY
jgi:hypothetical protein